MIFVVKVIKSPYLKFRSRETEAFIDLDAKPKLMFEKREKTRKWQKLLDCRLVGWLVLFAHGFRSF